MNELRKQCRDLEVDIENSLEQLRKIGDAVDPDSICVTTSSKLPEENVEHFIEMKLEQFKHTLEEMSEICSSQIDTSIVTSQRSLLKNLVQSYSEAKKYTEGKRLTQHLMGRQNAQTDLSTTEKLLRESESLDKSIGIGRGIQDAINEVRSNLKNQRNLLEKTGDKVVKFAETIPGVNVLIGRISKRHKFNAIVIGITIAICTLLILAYMAYA